MEQVIFKVAKYTLCIFFLRLILDSKELPLLYSLMLPRHPRPLVYQCPKLKRKITTQMY